MVPGSLIHLPMCSIISSWNEYDNYPHILYSSSSPNLQCVYDGNNILHACQLRDCQIEEVLLLPETVHKSDRHSTLKNGNKQILCRWRKNTNCKHDKCCRSSSDSDCYNSDENSDFLADTDMGINDQLNDNETSNSIGHHSLFCHLKLDCILASSIVEECTRSLVFQQGFRRYALKYGTIHSVWKKHQKDVQQQHNCDKDNNLSIRISWCFHLCLQWPNKFVLDYKWNYRVCMLVNRRLQMDDAMNWLNTLGGGYSALGDYFTHHALKAGHISTKQLRIAMETGEVPIMLRCYLYQALSSMQIGRLRLAKGIIRKVYRESQSLTVPDPRLEAMCKGIWSRLRYFYHHRKQPEARRTKLV